MLWCLFATDRHNLVVLRVQRVTKDNHLFGQLLFGGFRQAFRRQHRKAQFRKFDHHTYHIGRARNRFTDRV